MREPFVGAMVVYHPDPKLPEFHDKGHGVELPAVITKVWDAVVNLRVMLDSTGNPPFVFGSKYSEDCRMDSWHWPHG